MIGHSFLHEGLAVNGLSPAIVHMLIGGSMYTAASLLPLQDCPDLDYRDTVQLVSAAKCAVLF